MFPLEEGAAVSGFEAMIDGTHVVGRVQEREKAFATYDDALAAGHGAYLLDQERPDVFTASIGNVPPGKEVLVKVTYVAELSLEADVLRFAIPTTVSPRYAPADDQKGVGRTPAETLNPPRDWRVPYGLDLMVRIAMPSGIRSVESPSHPVRVEVDGRTAVVTLGGREAALDRDFVLNVRLAGAPRAPGLGRDRLSGPPGRPHRVPAALRRRRGALRAGPRGRPFRLHGGHLDRRGQERAAALPAQPHRGDPLQHRGFGSTFQMLFAESRPYDETSLKEASDHVAHMDADLGGTEILPALEAILARPPLPGPSPAGVRPHRRAGHQHGGRRQARAEALGHDPGLHVRDRGRGLAAPGPGHGPGRRGHGGVHRARRARRGQGPAAARQGPGSRPDRCEGRVGLPAGGAGPVARASGVRGRPCARLRSP